MTGRPLVLVTRPAGEGDPLIALLAAHDVRVAAVPTVAVEAMPAGGPLDTAICDAALDWVVVTSAAGVAALDGIVRRSGGNLSRPGRRWAAVGPRTAAALRELGIEADVVARERNGAGLAHAILATEPSGRLDGRRVLLARSDIAAADLPSALRAAGADVLDLPAYRTIEAPASSSVPLVVALSDPDLGAVVVASGSAVRGTLALATPAGLDQVALRAPLVAIGPATATVARDLGFAQIHQATDTTAEALASSVLALIPIAGREPALARRTP